MLVEHRGRTPVVGARTFLATGSSLVPGSRANTVLEDGALVPIGWVAVGDPARVLPRGGARGDLMERQAAWFGDHRDDRVARDGPAGPL